jgi:hypothetical protein
MENLMKSGAPGIRPVPPGPPEPLKGWILAALRRAFCVGLQHRIAAHASA